MAGRLYMVHLLSEDISAAASNGTSTSDSLSAVRIGSIRIELLGMLIRSYYFCVGLFSVVILVIFQF